MKNDKKTMRDVLLPWDDETIERLVNDEYGYLLDPNTPMAVVDAELRALGFDPEQIGAEGEALARKLLGTSIDA